MDVFDNNPPIDSQEWRDARALFQECYGLCYDATQCAIEEIDRDELKIVAIKGWDKRLI